MANSIYHMKMCEGFDERVVFQLNVNGVSVKLFVDVYI